MTELPKCKLCHQYPQADAHNAQCWGSEEHKHELIFLTCTMWNALMSTDTDRLEAGRKVMEAAAKRVSELAGKDNSDWSQCMRVLKRDIQRLDLPTILGIKAPDHFKEAADAVAKMPEWKREEIRAEYGIKGETE